MRQELKDFELFMFCMCLESLLLRRYLFVPHSCTKQPHILHHIMHASNQIGGIHIGPVSARRDAGQVLTSEGHAVGQASLPTPVCKCNRRADVPVYQPTNLPAYVSIRQQTSANVSLRQHTSAYVYEPTNLPA